MDSSKKYEAYLTYKAYSNLEKSGYIDEINTKYKIKWHPTHYVYMNMMGGDWTEEECDNVIYFVDIDEANKNNISFGFKNPEGV